MKMKYFASRCMKEIVRDPLSLVFGVGFPVVLMVVMMSLKRSIKNMPAEMYRIEDFTPGMIVFGISFLMMFLGILVANDRNSSFLPRLYSSPLTALDYIMGYTLPLIPIGIVQTAMCFVVAAFFGLKFRVEMLLVPVLMIPVIILFAGLGLMFGTLLNGGAVSGICSIIVNVSAFMSGTWINIEMVGGKFETICLILPFAHAVNAASKVLEGGFNGVVIDMLFVAVYAFVIYVIAAILFKKKMKN